jgi:nucleoside-triphosphatase THEP1
MYVPGFRELLAMLLLALLLLIALATQSPLLPLLLASLLLAWLAWQRKELLLELAYGERALLLRPVEVKFLEDPRAGIKFAKVEASRRARRAAELYGAFLRVRDYDPPRGSLGRTAERAIAAFHHPSAMVTLAAVLREGGYDYYVGLWAPDARVLRSALGDAARSFLSAGLYASAVDAEEVLKAVGSLGEKALKPTAPRLALAFTALVATSAALSNPLPAILALPLLPLLPYELLIARRGVLQFAPFRARQVVNTSFSVDETSVSGMVRSVAAVSQVAPPGSFVAAALAPADAALLEAKARAAMEVLDAARAGASRLREELRASRWLQVWRALQDGAAPFTALAVASEELARELAKCGLQPRSASLLASLSSIIPLGAGGELQVSHQLAWLAPHVFLRPRTRRTPKAIYLGRGLRRDEEVWLELDLLENVHGLIVGPMGSGKSTFARTLALRALERGIVPIIIDPSGEYRKFAERLGWEIIDLTDRKLDISACQASDLRRAFDYVSPLSDWEYMELKRALERGDLWSARVAALELIRDYFYPPSVSAGELLEAGKPFVLCLGSSARGEYVPMPVEIQRFAFLALLAQLRDYALAKGLSEPRWMLIVDEAHLLARPLRGEVESPVATVARMLRKFGLAVVLLTHDWRDIDDSYVRHCGWRLALSHSDPSYVEDTRVYMALTPGELSWFQRGLRGRAVLRRGFEPHNILVEVEPADIARPEVYGKAQ